MLVYPLAQLEHKEQAADALKLTAKDIASQDHRYNRKRTFGWGSSRSGANFFNSSKKYFKSIQRAKDTPLDQLVLERQEKFFQMAFIKNKCLGY